MTWTNRHQRPTRELIFNAHSHYAIPKNEIGLLAKTLEILRMSPSEAMSFDGPPLEVKRATLASGAECRRLAQRASGAETATPRTARRAYLLLTPPTTTRPW